MTLENAILKEIQDALERAKEDVAKTTAESDKAQQELYAARQRDFDGLGDGTYGAREEGMFNACESSRNRAVGAQTALETLLFFVKMKVDIYGGDNESKTA